MQKLKAIDNVVEMLCGIIGDSDGSDKQNADVGKTDKVIIKKLLKLSIY